MKLLRISALLLCLVSLTSVTVCIMTDWNDGLLLSLALVLSLAGNALNLLANRRKKNGKETES